MDPRDCNRLYETVGNFFYCSNYPQKCWHATERNEFNAIVDMNAN